MGFPTRLRQLREAKGMTQQDLGALIGVTKNSISSYERGVRTPEFHLLLRMADVFGVSTDYLLGHTERDVSPDQRLALLAIELGENGATDEDVRLILELLKCRRRISSAHQEMSAAIERERRSRRR
ncbi:helix-turn-helix domain-containing protein [Limnochorda pilosa]|uniref:Transcriptional regulator n=1 Tax=Limnochorda pilosa TaxID=1555112 RepID=A0A0K2SLS9_LIMPI|nr:helix-turn-helix transcriptional regulator [Limnochorda pilosa]BAS28060.1 transcriptional regulator [Limnochorda pilosa]